MTKKPTLIQAAVYVRCALASEEACQRQLAACTAFAAQSGIVIPESSDFRFTDNGSGGSTTGPDYKRLKEAIDRDKAIALIIARDIDRISRAMKMLTEELEWFAERGVTWLFLNGYMTSPSIGELKARAVQGRTAAAELTKRLHAEWRIAARRLKKNKP